MQKDIGKKDMTWLWVTLGIVGVVALMFIAWQIGTNPLCCQSCCKSSSEATEYKPTLEPAPKVITSQPQARLIPKVSYDAHTRKVSLYPTSQLPPLSPDNPDHVLDTAGGEEP